MQERARERVREGARARGWTSEGARARGWTSEGARKRQGSSIRPHDTQGRRKGRRTPGCGCGSAPPPCASVWIGFGVSDHTCMRGVVTFRTVSSTQQLPPSHHMQMHTKNKPTAMQKNSRSSQHNTSSPEKKRRKGEEWPLTQSATRTQSSTVGLAPVPPCGCHRSTLRTPNNGTGCRPPAALPPGTGGSSYPTPPPPPHLRRLHWVLHCCCWCCCCC